jgi:ABC-type Fe3+/spermidine/putrescine transport system ATPase subunit
MPSPLIETHNLVKKYGDKVAVNNVSFEVSGGEVFGFLSRPSPCWRRPPAAMSLIPPICTPS